MFIFILILSLLLRLVGLRQSLWLDEAIGALAVRDLSYREIFTSFLAVDNHPPLYYLLLKFWTGIFGYSEISLRMPSVLFGVGAVYLTFVIGKKVTGDKLISTVAALFLATSQFHIYYSQEARMYSMATFFVAVAVYAFLHLFEERVNTKYWTIFSISIFIMIMTDYMPVFLLPVFFVYAIYQKCNKHWWYRFLLSFTPIIIVGIFWLPIFQKQSAGGTWLMQTLPAWKTLAGGANIKQLILVWMKFTLGRISLADKALYYLFTIFASLPFVMLFTNEMKLYKKYSFLFLWLLLPLTFSFLASIYFPAFIYFRLLYVIPAFYLILALGAGNAFPRHSGKSRLAGRLQNQVETRKDSGQALQLRSGLVRMTTNGLLVITIVVINLISCVIYYTDRFQKRENWKEAVAYVEHNILENEIVLFSYPEPFAPYRWYEKRPELSFGATDSIKADYEKSYPKTVDLLSGKSGVYYFEYLRDLSDSSNVVFDTIKDSGFEIKKEIGDYNGVGKIYHLEK